LSDAALPPGAAAAPAEKLVAATPAAPGVAPGRAIAVPAHRFADIAIFIGVASSCVVMFEPALYDVLLSFTALAAFLAGLKIPRALAPLFVLMLLFQAGGILIFVNPQTLEMQTRWFVLTSLFLAFTCLYFACAVADRPERMRLIIAAYIIAAIVAALLGSYGYLTDNETLTRVGRAKGAFKDPNVFGPFLVLPTLVITRVMITGSLARIVPLVPVLLILLAGVFFSFSRAAWFVAAFGLAIIWLLVFLNTRDVFQRIRLIVIAIVGVAILGLALAAILSVPEIGAMFTDRAKLVQSYDGARLGRLARHAIGFEWVTRMPLGQGPLEFGAFFGEDPHNVYLKAFLGYGWLGGLAYYGLVLSTLARLAPLAFRDRPWRAEAQVVFATLLGHTVIGWVIDSDHWRHWYLLIGLAWAMVAMEARWRFRHSAPPS
jgi:O-antigen ligase